MIDSPENLPNGMLIAWYGDDFTGSAAVMEVLALAGMQAVLFMETPTPELLEKFAGFRGMGIAGVARSKSPAWMETHLPPVFRALARWGAPITHYKVCSTLDSAPQVGSIGKAVELARLHFPAGWIPLIVAAPAIQRYQVFGNLFAGCDGVTYRLDRHPTMSQHPVTPMDEADVRVHVPRQMTASVGLIDYLALRDGRAAQQLQLQLAAGHQLIAIDVLDETSLIEAGRLIWAQRRECRFTVGSQGIEYALTEYWRDAGLLPRPAAPRRASAVEHVAVVSGSCSPMTSRQIDWAEAHGFEPIRLDVRLALDEGAWAKEIRTVTERSIAALAAGRDPIAFTARGPDDPAIAALREIVDAAGVDRNDVNEMIGRGLGTVLNAVLRRTGIRRGILAGGDTSGHGMRVLDVRALTWLAATVPGAALFRAHSEDPAYANLELALKGGQMGAVDYFGHIKYGGMAAA